MGQQRLNTKIILPTFIVSILTILACFVLAALYMPGFRKSVVSVQETQTAIIDSEKTQVAIITGTAAQVDVQNTLSVSKTQTAIPTVTMTPTSLPTFTPVPISEMCDAKVIENGQAIYTLPGIGYKGYSNIQIDTPIKIIGRWPDTTWYKISTIDRIGWIRANAIQLLDINCAPTIFSVSYLLGMDEVGKVVLNDTFASNENAWFDGAGVQLIPSADVQTKEQQLVVDSKKQEVVTTNNQFIQNVQAFNFSTSVSFSAYSNAGDSFIGLRFHDNQQSYHEIQIFPGELCRADVFSTNQKINSFPINLNACASNSFYIEVFLSSNNTLNLKVNGYDVVSSLNLKDNSGNVATSGALKLVVNKGRAAFYFIAVTLP